VPEPFVINAQIAISRAELHFSYARSSGPGGQNVNKVNTKATLRWSIAQSEALPHSVRQRFVERFGSRVTEAGEVIIQSDTHREQGRNTTECLDRLRAMLLAVARPPRARKKTAPSRASKERRLKHKRDRSSTKQLRRRPEDDS
jgi:ribosome-associated protein